MQLIVFRVLNLVLEILAILLYPLLYLFLRSKNYQAALRAKGPNSAGGVLIHAASVGEINAVRPLVQALKTRYPGRQLVLTTTTLSGLKLARSLEIPALLSVLDLPWLRRKQLLSIDPKLIISVETEIWPNLLDQAGKQKRDVVFVNARLTARSLQRYLRFRGLLKQLQKPVRVILTQSDADAARFCQLFSVPVATAGNLKYALQLPDYDREQLRKEYGYASRDWVLCLGSSRPGEEALLQRILPNLQNRIPHLKLIVAPRHPKRVNEVQALFPGCALFSAREGQRGAATDVLIVDAIGHLNEFYALCDIAVVGGSFYDFGGHNPLEPAYYGRPVLMGPHHSSCAGSVRDLQAAEAILLSTAERLADDIVDLYNDLAKRASMGTKARACVRQNSAALETHLQGLEPWLK